MDTGLSYSPMYTLCSGMQGDAVGFRGMQECQQQPKQAMVDDGRPSHCDIRSATSISNAFFASVHTQSNFHQSSHCCKMFHKYHIVFISILLCNIEYMCFPCLSICPPLSLPCPSYMIHGRRYYTRYNIDNKYKIESEIWSKSCPSFVMPNRFMRYITDLTSDNFKWSDIHQ